jgi:glucose-1-phosphate cytidylyltransferase
MKVVILAGGYGTRISEESTIRPKPLVEIGGHPILWHIMKIYSAHGLNDFIVLCGYKGHLIKQFFRDYALARADVTFDLHAREMHNHRNGVEPWRVTLLDTGEKTMTGGRIKRARPYLDDDPFCLTYGDGVSDINVAKLIEFHRRTDALVTVSAVRPPGRFGVLNLRSGRFLRRRPQGTGLHRRRRHGVGTRALGGHGARRPGRGVPAPRLLAEHGHTA